MKHLARGEKHGCGAGAHRCDCHVIGGRHGAERDGEDGGKGGGGADVAGDAHVGGIAEQHGDDGAADQHEREPGPWPLDCDAGDAAEEPEQGEGPDSRDPLARCLLAKLPAALDTQQQPDRQRQREPLGLRWNELGHR